MCPGGSVHLLANVREDELPKRAWPNAPPDAVHSLTSWPFNSAHAGRSDIGTAMIARWAMASGKANPREAAEGRLMVAKPAAAIHG